MNPAQPLPLPVPLLRRDGNYGYECFPAPGGAPTPVGCRWVVNKSGGRQECGRHLCTLANLCPAGYSSNPYMGECTSCSPPTNPADAITYNYAPPDGPPLCPARATQPCRVLPITLMGKQRGGTYSSLGQSSGLLVGLCIRWAPNAPGAWGMEATFSDGITTVAGGGCSGPGEVFKLAIPMGATITRVRLFMNWNPSDMDLNQYGNAGYISWGNLAPNWWDMRLGRVQVSYGWEDAAS